MLARRWIQAIRRLQGCASLLLAVGRLYGFKPIAQDVIALGAGAPPVRPSRPRDVRETFGDVHRTMVLLMVHVLNEVAGKDIQRCLSYAPGRTVGGILHMFKAFGLLKARNSVLHKHHAIAFSFNEDDPLTPHVRAVLGALERTMPHWRIAAERQRTALIRQPRERLFTYRKPNKWKRPPAV